MYDCCCGGSIIGAGADHDHGIACGFEQHRGTLHIAAVCCLRGRPLKSRQGTAWRFLCENIPRHGHGNRSKKITGQRIRRYDPDQEYDEPTRLPVARHRQYGYHAKDFSDLISPLKRYLRTCVGTPWRTVHSELSLKLDRRSVSGSHIWGHVMQEIRIDCYIGDDGLAYSNDRRYLGRGCEYPFEGLYVHPKSGLVRTQSAALIHKRYRKHREARSHWSRRLNPWPSQPSLGRDPRLS